MISRFQVPLLAALVVAAPPPVRAAESWFRDVTRERGPDFVHRTQATGQFRLPEIMGGGAALFDCDGDGDLDAYLTSSGPNGLFRQNEQGRFVDATAASGLGDPGYGMGLAVGDVDNDGDADVYVANHGPDRLFRNAGDCRFEDVTSAAGITAGGWSSSAVFLDYDRDGRLDLYVARYVDDDSDKQCTDGAGRPDYCSPAVFRPASDLLLHNEGGGRFTDASKSSGIWAAAGAGLGVVVEDFDEDGWPDVYVANDGYANQLWINRRDGAFVDRALVLGVAYDLHGKAEAGMGVVAADLDGDLDADLFLTHLARETNTFYRNRGAERGFEEASGASGLGASSLPYTGFGAAAIDVELDGDLDLLVANGRVTRGSVRAAAVPVAPWDRFAEPNLLYVNRGEGRFAPDASSAAAFTSPVEISRGLAAGDVDGDGDLDLLLANIEGPARLLLNVAPRRGAWLAVRAVDPRYRRDAIGARVTVVAATGRRRRTIGPGFGYLSSSDARAHFGLGATEAVERLELRWPDGLQEVFPGGPANREVIVERGKGRAPS